MTEKKYQLAFCERFDPQRHGIDENSSPGIGGHFLIYETPHLEFHGGYRRLFYRKEIWQTQALGIGES